VALGDPLAYVRALHFAATILAAGAVIFATLVAAPAFAAAATGTPERAPVDGDGVIAHLRRCWAWLICASLAVAVLSGAIWLILLATGIYDAPVAEVLRNGGLWTVAGETRFGQVLLGRLAAAVLLTVSVAALMRSGGRGLLGALAVVLAIAVLIAPAWTGHAGATPGAAGQFPLAADALHLAAAGVWLGGLPPLAMLLAAAWRQKESRWDVNIATAVHRFSVLGMISVGTLLASGFVNSWYEVGTLNNLFSTTYGQLVLVKIGLFAAMIALATVNHFYLTPRLASADAVHRLYRNSLTETALGFAAVFVVGFLGAMAPSSHTHQHPVYAAVPEGAAFVHIHSVAGMADVTIMPGHVGTARATIRLWTEEDDPLIVQNLTFTLTPPDAASKPVVRTATQVQSGLWQVDGIELAQPGNWTAAVNAELNAGHRLALQAPIVIEPEQ
jgi:copper resistance protein D